MIDQEHLDAAVRIIADRDPDAAGPLRDLLAGERLVAEPDADVPTFRIDGERKVVRRHQLIHQGLPAVVERLVLAPTAPCNSTSSSASPTRPTAKWLRG